MKALTIRQPWATLIAVGAKRIETRSWATPYRGPLAIHAAKGFARDEIGLCHSQPFSTVLREHIRVPSDLPLGAVIATAQLVDVRQMDSPPPDSPEFEAAFGFFGPDRFGWVLADVTPLPDPVPVAGKLGLWDFDPPREENDR